MFAGPRREGLRARGSHVASESGLRSERSKSSVLLCATSSTAPEDLVLVCYEQGEEAPWHTTFKDFSLILLCLVGLVMRLGLLDFVMFDSLDKESIQIRVFFGSHSVKLVLRDNVLISYSHSSRSVLTLFPVAST